MGGRNPPCAWAFTGAVKSPAVEAATLGAGLDMPAAAVPGAFAVKVSRTNICWNAVIVGTHQAALGLNGELFPTLNGHQPGNLRTS